MSSLLSSGVAPVLQTAGVDTVRVLSASEGLAAWADVATIALAIFVAVLVLVAVSSLVQLRRFLIRSGRTLDELRRQADPVVDRAKVVAENMGYVSALVRQDVERLSSTVEGLTGRLQQASDRMEERIEEFNALLEVAQSEAETLFIDTASTVRAVRASARSLGGGKDRVEPEEEGA